MAKLTDSELGAALAGLSGWALESGEIVREYRLADFREVVSVVVRLAFEAEAADHHPDLDIRYNRLTVRLSTHSEGGVTTKDVELAGAIDRVAAK
ncbi:MAG: 4a-hydroxytetrahydrobiopterin dehydratase [Acidimicrobiales bacterium]